MWRHVTAARRDVVAPYRKRRRVPRETQKPDDTRIAEKIVTKESHPDANAHYRQQHTRLDSIPHMTEGSTSSASPSASSYPMVPTITPTVTTPIDIGTQAAAEEPTPTGMTHKLGLNKRRRSNFIPTLVPDRRGNSSSKQHPVRTIQASSPGRSSLATPGITPTSQLPIEVPTAHSGQ